jgi:hypothetical protein
LNEPNSYSKSIFDKILEQKNERFYTWFFKTYFTTEDEVYRDAGHEVLLYLASIKYNAILFFILWIVGGFPLSIAYIVSSYNVNSTIDFKTKVLDRVSIKAYQGVQQTSDTIWLIFFIFVISVTLAHM